MNIDPKVRATMACGYEPPTGAITWSPASMSPLWVGKVTTCPGYTTNLPDVIEIARARVHWSKSSLRDFCGGETPTEAITTGVEILEGACNEMQRWSQQNPEKK